MLQSHCRNYGEHKGLAVLNQNCQNLVHKLLSVTLEILGKEFSPEFDET